MDMWRQSWRLRRRLSDPIKPQSRFEDEKQIPFGNDKREGRGRLVIAKLKLQEQQCLSLAKQYGR